MSKAMVSNFKFRLQKVFHEYICQKYNILVFNSAICPSILQYKHVLCIRFSFQLGNSLGNTKCPGPQELCSASTICVVRVCSRGLSIYTRCPTYSIMSHNHMMINKFHTTINIYVYIHIYLSISVNIFIYSPKSRSISISIYMYINTYIHLHTPVNISRHPPSSCQWVDKKGKIFTGNHRFSHKDHGFFL